MIIDLTNGSTAYQEVGAYVDQDLFGEDELVVEWDADLENSEIIIRVKDGLNLNITEVLDKVEFKARQIWEKAR